VAALHESEQFVRRAEWRAAASRFIALNSLAGS
jgi:hypothetical protein